MLNLESSWIVLRRNVWSLDGGTTNNAICEGTNGGASNGTGRHHFFAEGKHDGTSDSTVKGIDNGIPPLVVGA